jgi:hypothetical protein
MWDKISGNGGCRSSKLSDTYMHAVQGMAHSTVTIADKKAGSKNNYPSVGDSRDVAKSFQMQ